jgi:hypothetical protein
VLLSPPKPHGHRGADLPQPLSSINRLGFPLPNHNSQIDSTPLVRRACQGHAAFQRRINSSRFPSIPGQTTRAPKWRPQRSEDTSTRPWSNNSGNRQRLSTSLHHNHGQQFHQPPKLSTNGPRQIRPNHLLNRRRLRHLRRLRRPRRSRHPHHRLLCPHPHPHQPRCRQKVFLLVVRGHGSPHHVQRPPHSRFTGLIDRR